VTRRIYCTVENGKSLRKINPEKMHAWSRAAVHGACKVAGNRSHILYGKGRLSDRKRSIRKRGAKRWLGLITPVSLLRRERKGVQIQITHKDFAIYGQDRWTVKKGRVLHE